MFFKKLDNLFPLLDNLFLYWIIFLLPFCSFGQTTADTYTKLWEVIQNGTVSNTKKIKYLEVYYKKARTENNHLEQYRALEKKTFLVSFADATLLLHQMHPLVQKIDNDSIKGNFLNRSTVFYYDNRDFKSALYYAIESEAFNEEINNQYNLNVVRITIGNIYYHTRHYTKAIVYFTRAKDYYQRRKDYNYLRGYISSLYSLSKTYWKLGDIDNLSFTIKESQEAVKQLKPKDQELETAYLDYLKGCLAFLQNDYTTAQNYFLKALPQVQQNDDFSNEHVIYLYLGKIAWEQNQKEEAVSYFTKIDTLFQEKDFLNYELRETYEYLIKYYRDTNEHHMQVKATESLMQLNKKFEAEQRSITTILHEDLEKNKLIKTQKQFQEKLSKSTIWISVLGAILLLVASYLFWKNYKKHLLKKNFSKEEQGNVVENSHTDLEDRVVVETEFLEETSLEKQLSEMSTTHQRLMLGLENFEREKGFLSSVTLEDLAKQLHTTRSTLSPFIKEYKKGFNFYINNLRIQQLVIDLKADKALRNYKIKELAAKYGDLHPKTLANLFKDQMGENITAFIEKLHNEAE